jgi:TolA-binding protein
MPKGWRMVRKALVLGAFAISAAGCAALGVPSGTEQTESRLQRIEQSQVHVATGMDDLAREVRNLQKSYRDLESRQREMEKGLDELRIAQAEQPAEPPLTVVKVESLPQPAALPPPLSSPPAPAPALGSSAPPPSPRPPSPLSPAVQPVPEKPKVETRPAPERVQSTGPDREDREAQDLYRRAFSGFRKRDFGRAILDFEEFLRRYPGHEYADNAQYWIGESYYSQAEEPQAMDKQPTDKREMYKQAIVEFRRLLDRYPDRETAPDALLKIGLCYDNFREADKAREFWNRLATKFPDTEAGIRARKYLREQARR